MVTFIFDFKKNRAHTKSLRGSRRNLQLGSVSHLCINWDKLSTRTVSSDMYGGKERKESLWLSKLSHTSIIYLKICCFKMLSLASVAVCFQLVVQQSFFIKYSVKFMFMQITQSHYYNIFYASWYLQLWEMWNWLLRSETYRKNVRRWKPLSSNDYWRLRRPYMCRS